MLKFIPLIRLVMFLKYISYTIIIHCHYSGMLTPVLPAYIYTHVMMPISIYFKLIIFFLVNCMKQQSYWLNAIKISVTPNTLDDFSDGGQCRKLRRLDGSSKQQSLDDTVANSAVASPISRQLESISYHATAPSQVNSRSIITFSGEESNIDSHLHKLPHSAHQSAGIEPSLLTSQISSTLAFSVSQAQHIMTSTLLSIPPQFQKYRPKLANMYAYQSNIPQDVWPPVKRVHHINLALIRRNQLNIGDDYARHTIRGSIDDIFQEKDEIKYNSVFENVKDGARILFEGRPGSGKTTVIHKISQDWEKGRIFSTSLLFLVSLRRFGGKSNIDLTDIIQSATQDFSVEEVTHLCKCIQRDSGKHFVFVLDGLDEYCPVNKKDNFIYDLISGRILLNSIVIFASRPVASQKFRKYVSKHIEVLGFLKPQIDEYIDSYYADNVNQGMELKKYLEQHPNVFQMCYLPINLVVVTYLFEKMSSSLPQVETDIYYSFTLHTLVRSLCKRKKSDELIVLRSFGDLEGEDAHTFELIMALAFIATVRSKQVFSRSDIEIKEILSSTRSSEANDSMLGLLIIDRVYQFTGINEIYTFLHLSYQEFLAACYVASLSPSKQLEIIEQYSKNKHLAVVWKFYCGLTRSKFTNEDEMKNFKLLMSQTASNSLLHIHCAHESQQKCVCTYVIQYNNAEVKLTKVSLHAADCTALTYVLLNSEVPVKVVELTSCHIGPEGFTAFVKGCGDRSLQLQSLRWLVNFQLY